MHPERRADFAVLEVFNTSGSAAPFGEDDVCGSPALHEAQQGRRFGHIAFGTCGPPPTLHIVLSATCHVINLHCTETIAGPFSLWCLRCPACRCARELGALFICRFLFNPSKRGVCLAFKWRLDVCACSFFVFFLYRRTHIRA